MNSDQAKGTWKQVRGKVKEMWGKLTDDDLDVIDGKKDQWRESERVDRAGKAEADGKGDKKRGELGR